MNNRVQLILCKVLVEVVSLNYCTFSSYTNCFIYYETLFQWYRMSTISSKLFLCKLFVIVMNGTEQNAHNLATKLHTKKIKIIVRVGYTNSVKTTFY